MKYIWMIIIGMIYLQLNAQTPEESIRSIMQAQSDAWNKADIDGFMKYYWNDPELTFVSKRGVSKGWQQVYDNYKKGYPNQEAMGILSFDQLVFDQMNTKAYMVTGSWHLQKKEEVGGWFTLIFKKIKKDWLIVYDHTS